MLTIENVDLFYGASQALRHVSLDVRKGEVTSLLGRNGVGKTSTLRAIVGQHPVSSGKITWEGKDITNMSAHQRAREGIAVIHKGEKFFRC